MRSSTEDLLRGRDVRVAEDDRGVPWRTEVLQQRGGCVPENVHADLADTTVVADAG